MLLANEASIQCANSQGWFPIHGVCSYGRLSSIHLLLKAGANVNTRTLHSDDTPLHVLAIHGHLQALMSLSPWITDIDPKNKMGLTPLWLAVLHGQVETVKWLLQQKADANNIIELKDQYLTPLLFAIQHLDLELVALLMKFGASPYLEYKKTSQHNILDWVQEHYSSHREIYEQLQTLLPGLPLLPPKPIHRESELSYNTTQNELIKPRQYLQSIGFSIEVIAEFDEESRQNKLLLKKQNRYSLFQAKEKKEQAVAAWLDGSISSDHTAILNIINPGNKTDAYCYLDIQTLADQGCEAHRLANLRLKFDGIHIKKLDKDKGIYQERIKLSASTEPQLITYTHELKINKIDRVLLFQVENETGSASLYIGARYIPSGLHTSAKINSLSERKKADNAHLIIQWPVKATEDKNILKPRI